MHANPAAAFATNLVFAEPGRRLRQRWRVGAVWRGRYGTVDGFSRRVGVGAIARIAVTPLATWDGGGGRGPGAGAAGLRTDGRVWCNCEDRGDTPCNVGRWRWAGAGAGDAGGRADGRAWCDCEDCGDTPCNVGRWRWAGAGAGGAGGRADGRAWCGGPAFIHRMVHSSRSPLLNGQGEGAAMPCTRDGGGRWDLDNG